MGHADDADTLRETIERYNDAWNRQDVDAIVACHAPDFVFHNWTANERVEADHSREHISRIFANTPTLRFTGRRLYARDGLVVSEWTARAERDGQVLEWDGVDVFPFENGLIKRKDVYSSSHAPRTGDRGTAA
ncbi:MAG TPA: nuclear transport factor 2 family protein [Gaiellaceae bacterium]|jgi:ketosteroid isomerase-like protein|nr:nuclear transport factor 2 family protein [Gaiellaceae bacterium]